MPKEYFIAKRENGGYTIGYGYGDYIFNWISRNNQITNNEIILSEGISRLEYFDKYLSYNTFRYAKSALTKFLGRKPKLNKNSNSFMKYYD